MIMVLLVNTLYFFNKFIYIVIIINIVCCILAFYILGFCCVCSCSVSASMLHRHLQQDHEGDCIIQQHSLRQHVLDLLLQLCFPTKCCPCHLSIVYSKHCLLPLQAIHRIDHSHKNVSQIHYLIIISFCLTCLFQTLL